MDPAATSEFIANLKDSCEVIIALLTLAYIGFFGLRGTRNILAISERNPLKRWYYALRIVLHSFRDPVKSAKRWVELRHLIKKDALVVNFFHELKVDFEDQNTNFLYLQRAYTTNSLPNTHHTLKDHSHFPYWRGLEKAEQEHDVADFLYRKAQEHFWEKTRKGRYEVNNLMDIDLDFLQAYTARLHSIHKKSNEKQRPYHKRVNGRWVEYGNKEFCSSALIFDFEEGFVARLELITGLLHSFGEDWRKFVHPFDTVLGQNKFDASLAKHFRNKNTFHTYMEYLLFNLNCWLVWGPSIPLNDEEIKKKLQFGYGDENESLVVDCGTQTEASKWLDQKHTLAMKYSISGRLGTDGVLYAVAPLPDKNKDSKDASGYYSAYFWVAFVLYRDGKPLFDGKERWKGFLPFFLHGNTMASAEHQDMYFRELAAKAIESMKQLMPLLGKDVYFQYACAVDDGISAKGKSLNDHLKRTPKGKFGNSIRLTDIPNKHDKENFRAGSIKTKVIEPYIHYLKQEYQKTLGLTPKEK